METRRVDVCGNGQARGLRLLAVKFAAAKFDLYGIVLYMLLLTGLLTVWEGIATTGSSAVLWLFGDGLRG